MFEENLTQEQKMKSKEGLEILIENTLKGIEDKLNKGKFVFGENLFFKKLMEVYQSSGVYNQEKLNSYNSTYENMGKTSRENLA